MKNLVKIKKKNNRTPVLRAYRAGAMELNIAARKLLGSDSWADADVFYDKDRPSDFCLKAWRGDKERKIKHRFMIGVRAYERLRVVAGVASGEPVRLGVQPRPINETYWKLTFNN